MSTISQKIRDIYYKSSEIRVTKLEDIKAPEVVIQGQREISEGWISGTIKIPGEVRGYFKKYLDQEFTEGFSKIIDGKFQMWFKISDNPLGYLHLYRDKWDNICFSITSTPIINKLTII